MFKKYREVYKVLERRWQTVHGFSFRDFSGWNAAQQSYITRYRPLWLIIEDWATMQRILVTHEGRDMEITYPAIVLAQCNTKRQLQFQLFTVLVSVHSNPTRKHFLPVAIIRLHSLYHINLYFAVFSTVCGPCSSIQQALFMS